MMMENDDKAIEDEIIEDTESLEVEPEEILSIEEQLRAQNADLLDKLQRSLAEFDNFRKRSIKEKAEMFDIGTMSMAERILPVADNFLRALDATPDKEDSMYKGIAMIYKQLEDALANANITPIECVDLEFNPNLHNAVAHEEIEGKAENTIVEELQKGYKYKDKVIRPSMVKVAK